MQIAPLKSKYIIPMGLGKALQAFSHPHLIHSSAAAAKRPERQA